LTNGQRAFAALRYEERYAEAAKEAQREGGGAQWKTGSDQQEAVTHNCEEGDRNERTTAARAAKATGTSRGSFDKAKAVERDAPDLKDRVIRARKPAPTIG
jgi:hypothetical protein